MTTYAPKFPEVPTSFDNTKSSGPLSDYKTLIVLRNLKVSIGAKLNYGK